MNKIKKIITVCIIAIFSFIVLTGCVRDTEYDDKEILTVLYYLVDGWGISCFYKLYDFQNLTYLEKDWESYEEYTIKSTFTQEKADDFFKDIKRHGIFLLKEKYETDSVIDDGGTSYLVITFSDKTTFKSSFYHKYPIQIKKLNKDFFNLSGYKLFN